MVYTSLDSLDTKGLSLILSHAFTIVCLQNSHGEQRTRAHGEETTCLLVTIVRDFDQLGTANINTTHDHVGADMTTVFEDMVSETAGSHLDAVFTVRVKSVKF